MSTTSYDDDATTDDVFLTEAPFGPLRILQPKDGLRSGLDAVLLAAAAVVTPGQMVLDAGSGVGVVGLSVARRCDAARIVLVERERSLADLAIANAARNGMASRATVVCADLTSPLSKLVHHGLVAESFDHVLANPPFHDSSDVRVSPRDLKANASAFEKGDLDRWLRFLAAMTKPGGTLTLIHRADALRYIFDAVGSRFGGLRVFPLFPRQGMPASRILVQGVKGSRAPLQLLQGLVLHAAEGGYLSRPEAILRRGAALALEPVVDD